MGAMEVVQTGVFEGLDAWLIESDQATAAISRVGGQVLSWRPKGAEDVLWLSPARQPLPTPIRGGIPVCWPYFGRQGQRDEVPSHGFVRTLPWQMDSAVSQDDGSVALVLRPPVLEGMDLGLHMKLVIGQTLQQRLVTRNHGSQVRYLTQALHNYFHVSDVTQTRVEGVDGLSYLDKYAGGARFVQQGHWVLADPRDPGRSDRIYGEASGHYVIHDPGMDRRIQLRTMGSRSVVIWSPGQETAAGMVDVGSAWKDYICVEAANAGDDVITLAPDEEHVLTQVIELI